MSPLDAETMWYTQEMQITVDECMYTCICNAAISILNEAIPMSSNRSFRPLMVQAEMSPSFKTSVFVFIDGTKGSWVCPAKYAQG